MADTGIRPVKKVSPGVWEGVNLTYYGLLNANAIAIAVSIFFVLTGAVRVPLSLTLATAFLVLLLCVPASRILARLIEKKGLHLYCRRRIIRRPAGCPGGSMGHERRPAYDCRGSV